MGQRKLNEAACLRACCHWPARDVPISHHVHDVTAVPCRYYQLMTQLHLSNNIQRPSSPISFLFFLPKFRPNDTAEPQAVCKTSHASPINIEEPRFKTCRYTTPSINELGLLLEKLHVLQKLVK